MKNIISITTNEENQKSIWSIITGSKSINFDQEKLKLIAHMIVFVINSTITLIKDGAKNVIMNIQSP